MPPTMLISSLESIRRKVRWLSLAFGAGVVAASAVGLVLGVVLLDYCLNLPPIPRVIVLVMAAATLAYAMYRWIVRPMLAKLTLRDVASRLEAAFPQFDDRLRSTVDFVRTPVPGSEFMKTRVVDETSQLASTLNLSGAIVTRPIWYSASAATGAIILLLSLAMLVTPEFRQIALSRILSPFQARAWPKSVEIALLGQTPARLPVGQHLDVRMKLSRGDRASAKAIVYYQYGEIKDGQFVGGPIQQEYMSRGTDGAFGSSLDTRAEAGAAASAMRVWIKSGDDERSLPDVLVVPRLTIRSVIANVTPPAYVSGGDARTQSIDLSKGAAIMPIGAQIKLDVSFSKPLAGTPQDVKFEPMEASMAAPKLMSSTASYGGVSDVWQARQSLRFRIRATDIDGFQNNALEEYEILVRPDQAPTVQIESPRRNEERTAVSSVPIQGLADDDYGIESLRLVVDRLGDKKHWDIPLVEAAQPSSSITWTRAENAGDRLRFRMNYNWILGDLPQADLKPGDVLEYSLLVKDNFALDGETHPPVASGRLRVAIISQEDLTAKVIEDLRQIKARINEVKNAQDRTQVQTRALADDTRNKAQLDAADRQAAERLANQQATAATQTRQLATRLDEIQARLAENQADSNELRDLARDVRNDLTRTAENPMKDASAQISAANQPTALQPRPGATAQPNNQQEQPPQQGTDANGQAQDQQASAQDQQPQQPQHPQQGNAARGDQQRPQTSTEARNGSPNGSQQDQQASAQDQQQRDNAGEASRENQQASAQDQVRGDQANQRDQQASAQQQGRNNAANGGRQGQANQQDQQASAQQQQPRNGAAGESSRDQQPGSQQQASAQQQGAREGNPQQGGRQGDQQQGSRQGNPQAGARQGNPQQGGREGDQQASAQQQPGSRQGAQQQNSQGRQGSQQALAQQQSGARQGGQQQGSQQQSTQQQGAQQGSQQQQGQQQPGSQQQQSPQQQQRNNALAQAQQNQQQASQQLQQALDRMENIGTMQQTIDRVAELLKQQQEVSRATQEIGRQNVGQRPEEMQPQDRQRLNQNADQQRQLAQRTQQAMQNMQRTAEQLQQSDPQSAQAMRQAAQTAQQQQVASRQQQAADQAQQNQQQQAQGSQRQAEQGLTIMLNQLNEAEKHKLAQLSKQLAQVQEQIDNLIRRQSGHNLDNLSLQGADKLAKLDAAERTDLFNQAGRDEKLPADAQLPALSTAQELTERNARDIGKSIEALPNNAEMAAQLTRAADKMERAIVFLRQSKLPDAYEPPQTDALNALLEAQKHIDDMKENVDEQIAQNQKEGVRQQYVQILQEQQQVNSETTKIDSTARGADGSLPRAESVRLGQLPGVQGKLSDRISGLEEQLTAAQSIVYVWANQDIAKSMNGVKDDLGNQQTGLPTRTEQKRIAEQLQAMIDNLVERPTRSKFAQDAGNEDQQSQGGQNGQNRQRQGQQQAQGTRKLPTAAELHLVQSLQKAVNSATKTLADQPEKDKPKLLALGNRQGELRGLLGQLLEKSSDGKVKLGAEPDNRDQLPEEANKEQVEKQELEKQLLTDEQVDEKTEKQVNLVGDRMARVRQRLAQNNDPGKTTQIIEDRIVLDIDSLIEQARQQQMQTRNSRQRQQQQQQRQRQQAQQQRLAQQNQPQNQGQQQNQQQGGNTPAANDQLRPGGPTKTDLSATIRESMQEWGGTTDRERKAVMEGANDSRVEPYEKLISDYYKSLATKEIQH